MKKFTRVVCLLSSLWVVACSNTPQQAPAETKEAVKAPNMLVITSAEPAKVLPAFTTFTWDDDYSEVLAASSYQQQGEVKAYIRQQLITYLQTKGYQYQPVPMQADVVIGFLYALQDTPVDKTLQGKFGVLPTKKQTFKPTYQQGTLLLNVLDTPLQKVYWRSALLGLTDLQAQMNMQNQAQMQGILHSILGGFPKAGR